MALTTEEVGRMMSYALQGCYSFEVWVEDQHIAQEDQEHARVLWDDTVANPGQGGRSGRRGAARERLVSGLCSWICAPEPRMAPSRQGAGHLC